MRSIIQAADPSVPAATRVVWLPGANTSAQEILDAGFSRALAARRLSLDLTLVDLELEHVGDRRPLERLRSEIVLPARAAGACVWLAGISLGGYFALEYAASHAEDLAGLCLLAPYLGNRMLTAEIAGAQGVADWRPGELAETDEERRIWRYIKTRRPESPPLYLGFGREDRFAAAQRLLAQALPADSVEVIDGGHDWRTWSRLWEKFLDWRFT
jgi:pimeloyl-ACP methyl ester carboxylesterase